MRRAGALFLLITVSLLVFPGCGNIEGLSLPYVASPRVEVQTPESPAEGNITISFHLTDREVEPADVTVEYSTNGGTTYSTATLTIPGDATNLASAWHPGKTHSVTWNSVTDMVGRSGAVSVYVKITPSDASNPSGTPGISGSFTVNNIAYNEAPTATTATPAGVQTGNVQINYFLADVESDTCSIAVLYSTNGGTSYQAATMGPAGDGVSGLSSSPSGTAHVYLWDSRADNVAPSGQVDTIKIRITPTDFSAGTAGDTNSFSVDNSVANDPPTVAITGGPADGSTVTTTQVTFTWSGSDTDGSVVGYYYSFDHDPPDVWTTDTTVTSGALSEASHIFRVVAVDDDSDLSTVASRSFTVSIPGTITAQFSGSPLTGPAPLDVSFTDLSTATNGITNWSWDFGNGDASTAQHADCSYMNAGSYTVSLTVTGPDGTDTETKTNYITVSGPDGETIHVNGLSGDDGESGLSWAYAVQTIQIGLDKAADNWIVLVADGTYTGTSNKNLDFGGRAIHLKSTSGATSCIIDCQASGRGFYFHSGETNSAIVEGFTVQNGDVGAGYGGAVFCQNGSNPTISNCILTGNLATYGGGIYCNNCSPVITNCSIENNTGTSSYGGIYCYDNSSPTITNCGITNNSVSFYGGGMGCHMSTPVLAGCTIAYNSTDRDGGGIYCYSSSSVTLNNTIIWGNSATENGNQIGTFDAGSTVTLNFCDYSNGGGDVEGPGTVTPGNCINLDPLFINATAQDYHLQDISPCVDAGDNSLIPPGVTTDLDGRMRVVNGTVDIGAYEYWIQPQYIWTRTIAATSNSYLLSCCTDTTGNLYVAGIFENTANFAEDWGGTDIKTSAGKQDIFITKIAYDGNYCWTRRMGGSDWDDPEMICADTNGNVYITGYFWGTVNFAQDWGGSNTKTSAGFKDIFITKLDPNGDYCWTHRMGHPDHDTASGVCTDGNGNVYVAGGFGWIQHELTLDFAEDWGGSDPKTRAGLNDIFVTKIGADGSYCWTHRMGGPDGEYACDVRADGNGNVYVVSTIHDTDPINFAEDWGGFDEIAGLGDCDVAITRINASGDYGWTRRIGGPSRDRPLSMCSDTSNNIYVAGEFEDAINFGEDWGIVDVKTTAGGVDAFLVKLDSSGDYCWVHRIGGTSNDSVKSICTDSGGNLFLTGSFQGSVKFADDWGAIDRKTVPGHNADAYITSLSTSGGYEWTMQIGNTESESGNMVCSDTLGNIYTVGTYKGTVNFAEDWGLTDNKTSVGDRDIFITKITPP